MVITFFTTTGHAWGDFLRLDQATYPGRVVSLTPSSLVFDFGCQGDLGEVPISEGMLIGWNNSCGNFEDFKIGGRDFCVESFSRDLPHTFIIAYESRDPDGDFIPEDVWAFDEVYVKGDELYWGINGSVKKAETDKATIEVVGGNICP